MPNWKTKWPNNNFESRKKNFTPNQNFEHNNSRNLPNKNFQENNLKGNSQQNPTGTRNREFTNNHSNYERKELVKCWELQGPHYASVYPNINKTVNNIHTVQEEITVSDLARGIPKINAML